MSLSIGEAIQNIQSIYSKGIASKDSRLTNRHIYSSLIKARSTIIRQMTNKKQKVNSWIYQVLPCVELIEAPIHECPCIPTNGCNILRTKYRLPTPIAGLDKELIQSVTTLDGAIRVDDTDFEMVKYDMGKKYTFGKSGWYERNRYGYITHKSKLKGITINGLFDDAIEVFNFPSICPINGNGCIDYNDIEFPIDRSMLTAVVQLASEELIIEFGQMKQDRANNASDDIEGGGQMVHQPNNNVEAQ